MEAVIRPTGINTQTEVPTLDTVCTLEAPWAPHLHLIMVMVALLPMTTVVHPHLIITRCHQCLTKEVHTGLALTVLTVLLLLMGWEEGILDQDMVLTTAIHPWEATICLTTMA